MNNIHLSLPTSSSMLFLSSNNCLCNNPTHPNSYATLSNVNHRLTSTRKNRINVGEMKMKVKALRDVSASVDPIQAEVTWQIVVGALAGVIPFIVAGIEFSKRIVAQRNCEVCGGSGLVLRDKKYYFKCPGCGGFLPWQSWKRFFSG